MIIIKKKYSFYFYLQNKFFKEIFYYKKYLQLFYIFLQTCFSLFWITFVILKLVIHLNSQNQRCPIRLWMTSNWRLDMAFLLLLKRYLGEGILLLDLDSWGSFPSPIKSISQLKRWVDGKGVWVCDLKWKRSFLFDHEQVLIIDLMSFIRDFTPSSETNEWRWRHSNNGSYFMTVVYSCLLTYELLFDCQTISLDVTRPYIWSSWPPLKSLCSPDNFFMIGSPQERIFSTGGFVWDQGVSIFLFVWPQ